MDEKNLVSPTENNDLDALLDKAEHTYHVEEQFIAPDTANESQENLEEVLATTNTSHDTPVSPPISVPTEQPVKHIHTYHDALATVQSSNDSADGAKILQSIHRAETEHQGNLQTQKKITGLRIGALVLCIIGALLLIGIYLFTPSTSITSVTERETTVSGIIPVDTTTPLEITQNYHFKIKADIQTFIKGEHSLKELASLYLVQGNNNGGYLLSTHDFFKALHIAPPAELLELFGPRYMLGRYTLDTTYPFLIFEVSSFPQARTAMINWEPTMFRDLKEIFALPAEYQQPEAFESTFHDALLQNQHVRILEIPLIEQKVTTAIIKPFDPQNEGEVSDFVDQLQPETLTESILSETSITEPEITIPDTIIEPSATPENELPLETTEATMVPPQEITQYERIVTGTTDVLYYSFINEKTLVITTGLQPLEEIIRRYARREIFLQDEKNMLP